MGHLAEVVAGPPGLVRLEDGLQRTGPGVALRGEQSGGLGVEGAVLLVGLGVTPGGGVQRGLFLTDPGADRGEPALPADPQVGVEGGLRLRVAPGKPASQRQGELALGDRVTLVRRDQVRQDRGEQRLDLVVVAAHQLDPGHRVQLVRAEAVACPGLDLVHLGDQRAGGRLVVVLIRAVDHVVQRQDRRLVVAAGLRERQGLPRAAVALGPRTGLLQGHRQRHQQLGAHGDRPVLPHVRDGLDRVLQAVGGVAHVPVEERELAVRPRQQVERVVLLRPDPDPVRGLAALTDPALAQVDRGEQQVGTVHELLGAELLGPRADLGGRLVHGTELGVGPVLEFRHGGLQSTELVQPGGDTVRRLGRHCPYFLLSP